MAREAKRRSIVVLNAWETDLAAQLKKANPAIRVLVYKDLSSTRSYRGAVDNGQDDALLPTGVGYVDADTNHPDWFALDAQGHRVEWAGQRAHWWMDVANPAYQQAWLANVSAELRRNHWDGVMLDNALTRLKPYLPSGRLQRFGDDAAVQAGTRSMLAAVGPVLQKDDFQVLANIADARRFPGLWQDWLTLLSGASEEHFITFPGDPGDPGDKGQIYLTGDDFQQQLDQIADAESAGRLTTNQAQGPASDRRARTYGLAAFLVVTDGSSTFAYGPPTVPEVPPEVSVAAKLGPPTGRYKLAGSRIYRRQFAHGVVAVNAGTSNTVTVATNRGLRSVAPASALILLDHQPSNGKVGWLGGLATLLVLADLAGLAVVRRRSA